MVSHDGQWFAYKISPNEGNSEVVIRNLKDGKEQRYPIGELPRMDVTPGAPFVPSPCVTSPFPTTRNGRPCCLSGRTRGKGTEEADKPLQTKLILIELRTARKTEFDKVRRFAFSGERSTAIAMQRYSPVAATPPMPAPPAPGAPAEDKPQGADLIVYELASGNELNFGNVSEFSIRQEGQLAGVADRRAG